MRKFKQAWAWIMALIAVIAAIPLSSFALVNTNDNNYLVTGTTPSGKVGKTMSFSVTLRNATGKTQSRMGIGIYEYVYFDDEYMVEEDRKSYVFPFEITQNTFTPSYTSSKLEPEQEKKLTLSAKVRKDISPGYYNFMVSIYDENKNEIAAEYINVWIGSASSSTEEDEGIKTADFALGEGQNTPSGVYPNIMNYSMNLRNNGHATVYDVKVSMVPDVSNKNFPFEINDANYDRLFDKIEVNETVELPYSMAIRSGTYSNYYAIKLKITYSESSTGNDRKEYETSYYVKITNKDEEDEKNEFNPNDRTKARVIVDSFITEPETIIAGEAFELICQIKNASKNISASNLLLNLESEKVSDSAVFTTESGASSFYLDDLAPDQIRELRVRMLSKPGIDQRSYNIKIKTQFDSPEYKNAEENLSIDIPVTQIARINTSSFEIMPTNISVGDETNVMFGINNTGKVLLYNVMVNFQADTIQPMETYVGNIKPGETGNVDCMLTGIAATADDGKIKVIITYEDENGEISAVEKEMQLYITEAISDWDDRMTGNMDGSIMEEQTFFERHKLLFIGCAAVAAVLVLLTVVLTIRRHRKKKLAMNEDMDDEID